MSFRQQESRLKKLEREARIGETIPALDTSEATPLQLDQLKVLVRIGNLDPLVKHIDERRADRDADEPKYQDAVECSMFTRAGSMLAALVSNIKHRHRCEDRSDLRWEAMWWRELRTEVAVKLPSLVAAVDAICKQYVPLLETQSAGCFN